MGTERVLIVDDDENLRELCALTLAASGYSVRQAGGGQEAIDAFEAYSPDLVLLDVGLGPESIDGLEVCKRLRSVTDVPIVMLTNRSEEIDQVMGLLAGADDYLVKPISMKVLPPKVASVLRRGRAAQVPAPAVIEAGGLRIDPDGRLVTVNGVALDLTRIQFDLLVALAENPNRVLTREQLIERVWGDWFGGDHHLDVHLSRLRVKVARAGGPRVGHAVRGVGFKFLG